MVGKENNIVKADAIYRGIKCEHFIKFADEYEKYAFKLDKKNQLKSFKYLKRDPANGTWVMQMRYKLGMMATDRQSLVEMKLFKITETKYVFLMQTIDNSDEYPELEGGLVKMGYYKGMQIEEKDGDLYLTQFDTIDLGGYFPKRLLNMILAQFTSDSLTDFHGLM